MYWKWWKKGRLSTERRILDDCVSVCDVRVLAKRVYWKRIRSRTLPEPDVVSFSKASVVYPPLHMRFTLGTVCGVCDGVQTLFLLKHLFTPQFATHSPLCKNMIIAAAWSWPPSFTRLRLSQVSKSPRKLERSAKCSALMIPSQIS